MGRRGWAPFLMSGVKALRMTSVSLCRKKEWLREVKQELTIIMYMGVVVGL